MVACEHWKGWFGALVGLIRIPTLRLSNAASLKRMTPKPESKIRSLVVQTPGKVLFTPCFISDLGSIVNPLHLLFHLHTAPRSSLRH